jgi:hypothetical protein
MQASHQSFLDLGNGKTSAIAWPEDVRYGMRYEWEVSQIALICEGVQCRAWATVLDVAAKVIVVRLAITQRLLIGLATSEEAFDKVNEPYVHLVVEFFCSVRVKERMTKRSSVERAEPASS